MSDASSVSPAVNSREFCGNGNRRAVVRGLVRAATELTTSRDSTESICVSPTELQTQLCMTILRLNASLRTCSSLHSFPPQLDQVFLKLCSGWHRASRRSRLVEPPIALLLSAGSLVQGDDKSRALLGDFLPAIHRLEFIRVTRSRRIRTQICSQERGNHFGLCQAQSVQTIWFRTDAIPSYLRSKETSVCRVTSFDS